MSNIHFPPRIDLLLDSAQLLSVTQGKVSGKDLPQSFSGLTCDSRAAKSGDLFVCLKTETNDGHRFIADAATRGATAALVDRDAQVVSTPIPLIQVENAWNALSGLAKFRRGRFAGTLCAVSGSNGKTTTRSLLTAILGRLGKTLSPTANWNNLQGVCLTLLLLDETYQYASLELGINHFGELSQLTTLVKPQLALLTNVGPVHLEFLSDVEGVARAKYELFQQLAPGACAVVNLDDPYIPKMELPTGVKRFTFSMKVDADVEGKLVAALPHTRLSLKHAGQTCEVLLSGSGQLLAQNALAAASAGLALGIDLPTIASGLAQAKLPPLRMQTEKLANEIEILLDCYNANPASMDGALTDLIERRANRRALLLGDMLELGAQSDLQHRQLGTRLAKLGVERCFLFGPQMKIAFAKALACGIDAASACHSEQPAEMAEQIANWLNPGDLLLVKGSRGMQLEKIVAQVRQRYQSAVQTNKG